jgi:hypothetical protein
MRSSVATDVPPNFITRIGIFALSARPVSSARLIGEPRVPRKGRRGTEKSPDVAVRTLPRVQ